MLDATAPESTGPWDRRRAAVRSEILAVAWEQCRINGLASLSLRELAAGVGMRAPSLYSYFAGKDAIYDAMFAQGQEQLTEVMAALPDVPRTRADLRVGTRAFFDFCTADPVRYQLMFQRTIPGFVPSPDSYALAVAHLERFGRQLAALGVRDERHIDLWTAMVTGLTDQQISNDPGGQRWGGLLDELVDLFCDHVGIPAATSDDPPDPQHPGSAP